MTWEEKLSALQSLTDTSLRMRKPGDWYVSATYRSIGGNGFLCSQYGEGKTPQEAIEADWAMYAEHLSSNRFIVIDGPGARKTFRWAGFMWREVTA